MFGSQEIDSSLVSLEIIFEASQSELFRFKFNLLSSKISEFNLVIMTQKYNCRHRTMAHVDTSISNRYPINKNFN